MYRHRRGVSQPLRSCGRYSPPKQRNRFCLGAADACRAPNAGAGTVAMREYQHCAALRTGFWYRALQHSREVAVVSAEAPNEAPNRSVDLGL
jgi:hypothetical protein